MEADAVAIRDWHPLESSPEVFTMMARRWGLPHQYSFVDVLGLDDELLDMVEGPVHAVIFLFPDTPEIVKLRGTEGPCLPSDIGKEPLWIPQVDVGHSCGTFAMIHAFAQNGMCCGLKDFFNDCRKVTPAERAILFARSEIIRSAHKEGIRKGEVLIRDTDWEDCDHFLSFVPVEVDGTMRIMEMDGNEPRTGGLDRGECKDVLRDVARIVKEVYLPAAGEDIHFSLMALVG